MASNGHDATMDGLLRSGLIYMSAVKQSCPDPEVVAAYYEHTLEAKEAASFERHLSRCGRCREQLAMMVRAEEIPAHPARQSFWLWDWRLLSPAIAALLILTVWGVRRTAIAPVHTGQPVHVAQATQPLVAMSRSPQEASSNAPVPEPPATPPGRDQQTALMVPKQAEKRPDSGATATATGEERALDIQPQVPPPPSRLQQNDVRNLPLNGRNFTQMAEPIPPPAAKADAEVPRSTTQSVVVTSEPALVPLPAPVPQTISPAPQSAGARLDERQLKALGAVNQSVTPQAAQQHSSSTIIQTPDPKILWRVAGGNFVERTENGGASWQGQQADPDAQLTEGSAPSNKICWLVGKAGVILVTKDAQHWKKIPPPVPADFVSVDAKSNSAATVTAADGQKFSTENEGKKWVPVK